MTFTVLKGGVVREMTPEETAQREADIAAAPDKLPRRYVPKYTILRRLQDADKLAAAFAAFDQLDRGRRELWHAAQDIWSEDPDTLALLRAIGADPDVILAP